MPPRRGFTLLDFVIGAGILALLVGIILSAAPNTWERANQIRCQSNIRNLTAAFLAFAHDHGEHLPGSKSCRGADPNPEHGDWLFGQYSAMEYAPQWGTIWKYVSNDSDPRNPSPAALRIYRCPSLAPGKPGAGFGSNGRFDYAAFSCFSGALIGDINPVSELHFPMDPANPSLRRDPNPPGSLYDFSSHVETHPTPLVCQEQAVSSINAKMDGQHCGLNRMSHVHNGASWYGGVDGGLYQVNEPDTDPSNARFGGTLLWWQVKPRRTQPVNLDGDPGWDGWSRR